MPPFQHFTTKAKEAVRKAHELAVERGQNHVNPLHLLAALILQEESFVGGIIDKLEVDAMLLSDSILEAIEGPDTSSVLSPSYQLYLTPELVQALERSAKVATELHDEFVSTEHLFISIIDVPGTAREILARFRISRDAVMRVLQELRAGKVSEASEPKKFRALSKYTRSLTKQALENKLDPVIGRDDEIQRVIQILSRRTKNNPILIGEAGVGKTAIAEGLAGRIAVGDVIRAVEGKVVEGKVFDETCKKYDHGSQMCCHTSRCSIRPVWLRLAQTIENFLNDISLAQLLHQEPRVLALLRRQPPVLLK